jgi:hypothetical protein
MKFKLQYSLDNGSSDPWKYVGDIRPIGNNAYTVTPIQSSGAMKTSSKKNVAGYRVKVQTSNLAKNASFDMETNQYYFRIALSTEPGTKYYNLGLQYFHVNYDLQPRRPKYDERQIVIEFDIGIDQLNDFTTGGTP